MGYHNTHKNSNTYTSVLEMKFLLAGCGSFNPVHNYHLRMMELTRDALKRRFQVHNCDFKALLSPTSDAYKKKGLQPYSTRSKLISLSTQTSNWIELSSMEGERDVWTPTATVLSELNALYKPEIATVLCVARMFWTLGCGQKFGITTISRKYFL